MKVCYLSNSVLPSRYANSVHVANMAHGLSCTGAEVTLLAFRGDQSLLSSPGESAVFDYYGLEPSFDIEWLPGLATRGRSVLSSLAAWVKLRRLRPDLAIGRHGKACAAACALGIPTVYETHRPLTWNSRGDRLWLSRMFKSRSFRGLVTISKPLQDILVEETGLDRSRVLVAHDAAKLPSPEQSVRLGPPDRLQVGYVGAFYPGRGIELILEIAAASPDMDFHLIGGLREDLLRWNPGAAELANVQFHGFQAPSRAAALRAGFDVLLAPYQRETFIKDGWDTAKWMSPLKIFEYMSSAKPILCSDLPVLREVMVHEGNCLLLSPEDSGEWVAALNSLRSNPDDARALGKRAFESFVNNYTWEQRAQRVLAFASGGQ